jgi:hypothetical protein
MGLFQFESLESRFLLSGATDAQAAAAQRKEMKYAAAQLNGDLFYQPDEATIAAARAAVVHGSQQQKNLFADQASAQLTLDADQAALTAAVNNGLPTVLADYKNGADVGKLAADQAAYGGAVLAAVTKSQADQASTDQQISNDKASIAALLQTSPAYLAAVAKKQADVALYYADQTIAIAAAYEPGGLSFPFHYSSIIAWITNPNPIDLKGYLTGLGGLYGANTSDTRADSSEIGFINPLLSAAQHSQSADSAALVTARAAALAGSSQRAALRTNNAKAITVQNTDLDLVTSTATAYLAPVIADYQQHNTQQLATDQAALQAVVLAAVNKVFSDQTAYDKAIAANKAAIADLLQTNPAYTSALAKQQADASSNAVDIQGYQAILSAVDAKLKVDETNAPITFAGGVLQFNNYASFLQFGTQSIGIAGAGTLNDGLFADAGSSSVNFVGPGTLNVTAALIHTA